MPDNGGSIRFDTLDVRDEEAWAAGLAACVKAFGQPNVLINNAGALGSGKPVHEETVEAMRAAFDSNVLGIFLGMKTVIPGMIELGGGAIVNVSSVWGWSGVANNAAYQTAEGRGGDALQERRRHLCAEKHPHQLPAARLRRYADVARRDPRGGRRC